MAPIGIRYYNCRNAGIGIIIWPQLRYASNNESIVWDGKGLGGYKLYINSSVTVDLKEIGMSSGQEFILAENTLFGTDMWDSSQVFFYDPNSDVTAFATKWGGIHDGSLTYGGCKPASAWANSADAANAEELITGSPLSEQFEAYAAAVTHERIRELLHVAYRDDAEDGPGVPKPWKGIAKWAQDASPASIAAGILAVAGALMARRYGVISETVELPDGTKIVKFLFGPLQRGDEDGAVPMSVQKDWNAAVEKAAQHQVIDGGVSENDER
ncbi:hypothetical protein F4859DRAFT_523092 [Xylaria cf. heliscus]|nr:hypothetical protein F4859DRAFT_523092 [Xylaria cf. heliscus]